MSVARKAIGAQAELYVDANGAYTRDQALALAEQLAEQGVTCYEDPVSSDGLEGLRLLRDRGPKGVAVADGAHRPHGGRRPAASTATPPGPFDRRWRP